MTTTNVEPSPRLSGFALTVVLSAVFLAQFDFFVVNVAAPSLQRDLDASDVDLELIVGAYAFAYAAGLVLGGRLGDLFGQRRMFVIGTIAFAGASGLCGIAGTPGQLTAARLAQGLAAAMMLPQVLGMIARTGGQRPAAMAWFGVAGGTGSIAGQVLGGFLVQSDIAGLGWRPIFLIAVPVGVVTAALAPIALHRDRSGRRPDSRTGRSGRAVDPLGAAGLAVGVAAILVPLATGRTAGWPLWTWLCLAAAVPVLLATWWWQRLLDRRGGAPLLDPGLLRSGPLLIGLTAVAAFMAYFASYMFTLTLLLQRGLGLDPLSAGFAFVPAGVSFAVFALLAPRTTARFGVRSVVAGCLVSVLGLAALAALTGSLQQATPVTAAVALIGVISAGNGLVMPSLIGATLHGVPARKSGTASGMLTTAQQFGGAAGVAVIGTIYFAAVPAGHGTAMARAATICGALALAVASLVVAHNRIVSRGSTRPPGEDTGERSAGSAVLGSG